MRSLRARCAGQPGHTLRTCRSRCARRACGARGTCGPNGTLDALHARRTLGALEARPTLQSGRTLGAHQVDAQHRPHASGLGTIENVARSVDVEVTINPKARRRRRRAVQHGLARNQRLPRCAGVALVTLGTGQADGALRSHRTGHTRHTCYTAGSCGSGHTLRAGGALGTCRAHGADD